MDEYRRECDVCGASRVTDETVCDCGNTFTISMQPGDRVTVTMSRSPSREGEYVEDRGTRCRVLLDGEHVTRIVLRERVKPDHSAAFVAGVAVARSEGASSAAVVEVADAALASGTITPSAYLTALRAVPKPPKRLRSDRYLAFVRKHPCLVCHEGVSPREAHHFGPHGMSVKCDDFRAVSLCQRHHREFHDRGVIGEWNREETERMFTVAMRDLLMEWFGTERDGDERDAIIVTALINHIRESQT